MTFEDYYKKPLDPANKRGPHHLKLGRGLNTDRKNLGIVAKMHQLDPDEHPIVRKLKNLSKGREFIHNAGEAQKIASKYGIDLGAVRNGEVKTLGNKTNIKFSFDERTGLFVLSK